MNFIVDGFLARFCTLIGIEITSATGMYIAFTCGAFIFAIIVISFMVLLFRFLCYIRRG